VKTPPDLRQEALISVVGANWENQADQLLPVVMIATLTGPNSTQVRQRYEKSARSLPGRAQKRASRRHIGVTTPAAPNGTDNYPPGRILRGKWVLHA